MANVEFFKQQSKKFFKDYNSRVFNAKEGFYEYSPRYFKDIEEIILSFDINEEAPFTLMNAQHIIACLSGFYKWNELIKASESALEIGKLLLINRANYQLIDEWKSYKTQNLKDFDDKDKLDVFKIVMLGQNYD